MEPKGIGGAHPVAESVAPEAVAVTMPLAVAVGVAVPLVVAPELVMAAVAMVPERAPLGAAIGENPVRLVVGLPGLAPPVVPSVGGGGARNGAGRDQGGGAQGENRK